MALRLKANRRFPSIPVVVDTSENHTQVLMAVKEALDIGQRRTGDLLNSFIRVEDLIDLGLITIEGNTNAVVGADLSEIANIGDLSGSAIGDFLRFDGTDWVNDQLSATDITQAMVTQHQAALSINWSQLTGSLATIPIYRLPGATWVKGSSAITVPVNDVSVYFPEAAYILGVVVLCHDVNGTCTIDIWKDSYANFPPAVGDSICAAAKPAIAAGRKYLDTTLTGWTRDIAAGDTLTFHLDAVTNFKVIHVYLITRAAP